MALGGFLKGGAKGATRLKEEAAEYFGKAADEVTEAEADRFLQIKSDEAAGGALASVGKSVTKPLGIGALGLGGAYAYGEYSNTRQEGAKTERYQAYLDRLKELRQMYEEGEISELEYRRLVQQAEDNFLAATTGAPQGLLGWLNNLGTIETVALLVSAAIVLPTAYKAVQQAR